MLLLMVVECITEKRFKEYYQGKTIVSVHDTKNNNELVNILQCVDLLNRIADENEQLKEDNTSLIHLLENQSIVIQELHSKLLEHQVKEPIKLTVEDIELMGKAISYYTHGRCGE